MVDVDVDASGCDASIDTEEEDEGRGDDVKLEISHLAIEPSLLAVKRYLQSSLVVAHVKGSRWTRLLVVARDDGA